MPSSLNVELLVHVTAPSRTADDATYRRLAQGYADFDPTSCHLIRTFPEDKETDNFRLYEDDRQTRNSPDALSTPPQFVTDSQDLSFQSVFDNRKSPRLRSNNDPTALCFSSQEGESQVSVQGNSQGDTGNTQKSWCAPPSQISDSYLLSRASHIYTSPTQALESYIIARSFCSVKKSVSLSSSPEPLQGYQQVEIPSSFPEEADSSYTTGKCVIPVTPLLPAQKRNIELREDEDFDVTHISSSNISRLQPTSSSRGESEPSQKLQRTGISQTSHLIRSSSDTTPSRRVPSLPATYLEVWPPEAPIGVDNINPQDLIPPNFAKLATDLSSRYRPEQLREITPYERGYWRLNCSAWPAETRTSFWDFLVPYIRGGLAGWGVWAQRSEGHEEVRVFCWGCCLKNTYLLLYLASGRGLKFTGAEWVGADMEVAVRVLPVKK